MDADAKYTPDECVQDIPCRVWLPLEGRALLVDLVALPLEAMTMEVIAHSLATKNRYNGATPYPYSVATHSVLVSLLCPPELAFEGLMHDATEAFVGDLIHPIKRECPEFKKIENIVDAQLRAFYALPQIETKEVKDADTRALWLEQMMLQGKPLSEDAKMNLTAIQVLLANSLCHRELDWVASRSMFCIHYDICMKEMAN